MTNLDLVASQLTRYGFTALTLKRDNWANFSRAYMAYYGEIPVRILIYDGYSAVYAYVSLFASPEQPDLMMLSMAHTAKELLCEQAYLHNL